MQSQRSNDADHFKNRNELVYTGEKKKKKKKKIRIRIRNQNENNKINNLPALFHALETKREKETEGKELKEGKEFLPGRQIQAQ